MIRTTKFQSRCQSELTFILTILILAVFLGGCPAIAMEHKLGVNKAAIALLISIVCWTMYVVNLHTLLMSVAIPEWFRVEVMEEHFENVPLSFVIETQHLHQTGEIASILFFLLGAMTVVELVRLESSTHPAGATYCIGPASNCTSVSQRLLIFGYSFVVLRFSRFQSP
jgi:hypothetical protein